MKLDKVLNNINLALNYPSLTYADISLYFDMAIAELNTTLHTSIPTVSDMIDAFEQKLSKEKESRVRIYPSPEDVDYIIQSYSSTQEAELHTSTASPKIPYYFNWETRKFYVMNSLNNTYTERNTLEGVYIKNVSEFTFYDAVVMGDEVFWAHTSEDPILECDFAEYLPDEWVLLWLIPYVCFKYTVRDGGTAATFAEELTQGFQQLQETYSVPSTVLLATYADKEAYKDLVIENLPNLNKWVPTKAIFQNMKHSRISNAIYSNMYDRGGFND
jgi:hypothetical protein